MNEQPQQQVDEILQHPNVLLRAFGRTVIDFSTVPALAERMRRAMKALHVKGVGLAANQIGVLERVIVIDCPLQQLVMVNPVIKRRSGQQRVADGCLSVQHGTFRKFTCRASEIFVEFQDENGDGHGRKYTGLVAAIIQHEVDHLNGKIFTDLLMGAA